MGEWGCLIYAGMWAEIRDNIGCCSSNLSMSANFSPYEDTVQYDDGHITMHGIKAYRSNSVSCQATWIKSSRDIRIESII
jgi:hypothetical protein